MRGFSADVTVVIPVYNSGSYLKECIDSVLSQTFSNISVILVDDGSNDDSGAICDEYAQEYGNVTALHKNNGGQSSARNAGMDAATGKYIYFLDSDDYLLEDAIEKLVDTAEEGYADVVFFEAESFYDDSFDNKEKMAFEYSRNKEYGTESGVDILKKLDDSDEYYVCVPLHFYKRDYLVSNNIRFEEGIVHEDDLFTAKVYLCNGLFSHCHYSLYKRRIRSGSTMTETSGNWSDFRYKSYVEVYYGITDLLKMIGTDDAELWKLFGRRTVYYEEGLYGKLRDESKIEYSDVHNKLKKHALMNYGKYDFDIAYICSGGIRRSLLKIKRRFKRLISFKNQRQ